MKKFSIDKQTLKDLNIHGKYSKNSIFSLFNKTITKRGEFLLEIMFTKPLCSEKEINDRSSIIQDFCRVKTPFAMQAATLENSMQYLNSALATNYVSTYVNIAKARLMAMLARDEEYDALVTNINITIEALIALREYFNKADNELKSSIYYPKIKEMVEFLNKPELVALRPPTSIVECLKCELTLRKTNFHAFQSLIEIVSEIDVYHSVAAISNIRGFKFGECIESDDNIIDLKQVYHPYVYNAVANNINLETKHNVMFLTGANMAGKSTFMKSYGVAIYLAHMGFPLAVESARFTLQDGIYTSINVPDNLDMGYSHFYAEVVRVKYIAQEVASNKRLVIMFDELFKGTNVKDAYDATVAITSAFSRKRKSTFIISTHIMEAGQYLQENSDNIQFKYLPTILDGAIPRYTYTLADGIADDRHGMRIINNENIIEIILSSRTSKNNNATHKRS